MRQVRTQQSRLAPALPLISFRLTSLRQGYGGPPKLIAKAEATKFGSESPVANREWLSHAQPEVVPQFAHL